MRIRYDLQASVWAILLGIAAVCAQAPSSWAEDIKVAKTRKPPSVCVGLDESTCGGKAVCYWRKATVTKTGKTRRAHCRIKRSTAQSDPA
jgi:hypothetical protein